MSPSSLFFPDCILFLKHFLLSSIFYKISIPNFLGVFSWHVFIFLFLILFLSGLLVQRFLFPNSCRGLQFQSFWIPNSSLLFVGSSWVSVSYRFFFLSLSYISLGSYFSASRLVQEINLKILEIILVQFLTQISLIELSFIPSRILCPISFPDFPSPTLPELFPVRPIHFLRDRLSFLPSPPDNKHVS